MPSPLRRSRRRGPSPQVSRGTDSAGFPAGESSAAGAGMPVAPGCWGATSGEKDDSPVTTRLETTAAFSAAFRYLPVTWPAGMPTIPIRMEYAPRFRGLLRRTRALFVSSRPTRSFFGYRPVSLFVRLGQPGESAPSPKGDCGCCEGYGCWQVGYAESVVA